jgi:hypothetical protein
MSLGHGGKREGSGRPRGTPTGGVLAPYLPVINGLTPLEFLLNVVQAPEAPLKARIEAAKAAAPYCHAKLEPKRVETESEAPVSQDEAAWSEMLSARPN